MQLSSFFAKIVIYNEFANLDPEGTGYPYDSYGKSEMIGWKL